MCEQVATKVTGIRSGKTRQAANTSQETCLYESPIRLRGLGLVEIDTIVFGFLLTLFLRNDTGDFYLEKQEEIK